MKTYKDGLKEGIKLATKLAKHIPNKKDLALIEMLESHLKLLDNSIGRS